MQNGKILMKTFNSLYEIHKSTSVTLANIPIPFNSLYEILSRKFKRDAEWVKLSILFMRFLGVLGNDSVLSSPPLSILFMRFVQLLSTILSQKRNFQFSL